MLSGPSMRMVLIRPGTIEMGPRFEKKSVAVTHPFYLQDTEVTQEQYLALVGSNPSTHDDCGLQCPVEMVSWIDAVEAANALSKQANLPECYVLTECYPSSGQQLCENCSRRFPCSRSSSAPTIRAREKSESRSPLSLAEGGPLADVVTRPQQRLRRLETDESPANATVRRCATVKDVPYTRYTPWAGGRKQGRTQVRKLRRNDVRSRHATVAATSPSIAIASSSCSSVTYGAGPSRSAVPR